MNTFEILVSDTYVTLFLQGKFLAQVPKSEWSKALAGSNSDRALALRDDLRRGVLSGTRPLVLTDLRKVET